MIYMAGSATVCGNERTCFISCSTLQMNARMQDELQPIVKNRDYICLEYVYGRIKSILSVWSCPHQTINSPPGFLYVLMDCGLLSVG